MANLPDNPEEKKPAEDRRQPKRRRSDVWMPIIIAIGCVIILVTGVTSTVAFLGISKAEDAADRAEEAADSANEAIKKSSENTATIDDLCLIVEQNKASVKLGVTNTEQFLESPVAEEIPGFSAYIEQVSLPQAKLQLKNFFVPESCVKREATMSKETKEK